MQQAVTMPGSAADVQGDDMAWEIDGSFERGHHRHSSSNVTTADELAFAGSVALGAQFDNNIIHPEAFNVHRDLSTQTAPPFRATQVHVSDYRDYQTDSCVGQRQNAIGSGFRTNEESNAFPPRFGDKLAAGGIDLNGPCAFTSPMFPNQPQMAGRIMSDYNEAMNGTFHEYLPVAVYTPGTFKFEPGKAPSLQTVSPAYLARVPPQIPAQDLTLDSSWTASSTDFDTPGQQDLALRPKSKKRRRNLRDDSPRFGTAAVSDHKQKAVVDSFGQAVVSPEAGAMFETWLEKFKSIYPGEEHFRALTTLTEVDVETVRLWFTQKLRSKTAEDFPAMVEKESPVITIADLSLATPEKDKLKKSLPVVEGIKLAAATWVREEKGTKCVPVTNIWALQRNPARIFQCTMKCGQNFEAKHDWQKHEEVNYPQEGWICDLKAVVNLDGCSSCCFCKIKDPSMDHVADHHGKPLCHDKEISDRGRLFYRKQHFWQHVEKIHPGVPRSYFLASSHFFVDSKFPRRCGFCPYQPSNWKDRIEHIGGHFSDLQDPKDMTTWKDDDDHLDHQSDHDEDDDNDDDQDYNEKDADHDNDTDLHEKDERFTDRSFKPSEDDSNGPPPPAPRQRSHRNPEYRHFYQGYNLATPKVKSSSLSILSNLLKDDCRGDSLDCSSVLRRVSLVSIAEDREPYTRVKLLGVGPYSIVDEVQDVRTGLILARKTIQSPNLAESHSLNNEVEIMKRLRHPHIVQFLGTYEDGPSFSILMNPSADCDLGYYMETHAGKDIPETEIVVNWFSCLVSSVKYLHEKSVKHQDIKPSNILLKNGTIMLADFGIAKSFSDSESTSSTSGAMTRKYCAPETSRQGVRGRSSDIFSLGCVLLEMFSFLIYVGEPTFKEFQSQHFSGDCAYHENISHLKSWIEVLKTTKRVVSSMADLIEVIDNIELMMDEERPKRPTATDLSASFKPRPCCSLSDREMVERTVLDIQAGPKSSVMNATFTWERKTPIIPFDNTALASETTAFTQPTSPKSTPHSSRRNSHYDPHFDMHASLMSTPRTSLGSLFPVIEDKEIEDTEAGFLVGSYDSAYYSQMEDEERVVEVSHAIDEDSEGDNDVNEMEEIQANNETSRQTEIEDSELSFEPPTQYPPFPYSQEASFVSVQMKRDHGLMMTQGVKGMTTFAMVSWTALAPYIAYVVFVAFFALMLGMQSSNIYGLPRISVIGSGYWFSVFKSEISWIFCMIGINLIITPIPILMVQLHIDKEDIHRIAASSTAKSKFSVLSIEIWDRVLRKIPSFLNWLQTLMLYLWICLASARNVTDLLIRHRKSLIWHSHRITVLHANYSLHRSVAISDLTVCEERSLNPQLLIIYNPYMYFARIYARVHRNRNYRSYKQFEAKTQRRTFLKERDMSIILSASSLAVGLFRLTGGGVSFSKLQILASILWQRRFHITRLIIIIILGSVYAILGTGMLGGSIKSMSIVNSAIGSTHPSFEPVQDRNNSIVSIGREQTVQVTRYVQVLHTTFIKCQSLDDI